MNTEHISSGSFKSDPITAIRIINNNNNNNNQKHNHQDLLEKNQ